MRALFIADGSLNMPLLHSQGIPLLKELSKRGEKTWILSFEESLPEKENLLSRELAEFNIHWLPIVVNSDKSSLRRVQMICKGFIKAFTLCRREAIDVIHCRSYRPAVIGSLIKSLIGNGFLFDMRGFLIDEQVMSGHWKAGGLKYTLARLVEKSLILNADYIVTTSPQFSDQLLKLSYYPREKYADRVISIPNCVDTNRFAPDSKIREKLRRELGWSEKVVVIFSGDSAKWESFDYIINWFLHFKGICPRAFLAILAYGRIEDLLEIFHRANLSSDDFIIQTVPPIKMPSYLNAADIGIVFRKANLFTQRIASPVKFGEYLACGLPVIINSGIGETQRIVDQYRIGIVIDLDDQEDIIDSGKQIFSLLKMDKEINSRCCQAAASELSLDFAVQEYSLVYNMVTISKSNRHQKRQ